MLQMLKQKQQHSNNFGAMEREPISKNRVSPKNVRSRRNFLISTLVLLCLFLFSAFSAFSQNEKLRVAIIDLTPSEHMFSSDAKALTSILTTELVNTNKYRVVERSKIEEILNEQGLQNTQDVSSQAVKIGRLLGVRKIITGECIGGYYRPYYRIVKVSLRFIDIESGDIEAAITIDCYTVIEIRKKNGKKTGKIETRWMSDTEISTYSVIMLHFNLYNLFIIRYLHKSKYNIYLS